MHRGYTKRWRKRWDKGYHKDHLLWIMMDYFIDHANFTDSEVFFPGCGVIPLKRGQHIFGTKQIALLLGVDRNRIRRKLKILKNLNFLTIKSTNKYSIATIINYDTYNPLKEENDQQNDSSATSNRPATDQQPTTPNKDNKDNKEKNKPIGSVLKTFDYPDWLNKELWSDFHRMRSRIRKPITTERTIEGLLRKLKGLMEQGFEQDEIIQAAIDNCWQTFYPPKKPKDDKEYII